jgi:hypothetical protein
VIAKTTFPVAPEVTFAVKATAWLETDGFCEEATVVVVTTLVYVYVLPDPVPEPLVTVTSCGPLPPADVPVGV